MSTTPKSEPPGTAEPPEAQGIDMIMQPQTQIIPQVRTPVPLAYDPTAFDLWLRKELGHLHSTVLSEPVPQHLLDILQQPKSD